MKITALLFIQIALSAFCVSILWKLGSHLFPKTKNLRKVSQDLRVNPSGGRE